MSTLRAAEECLKHMSEKDLLHTLSNILNDDYMEEDFSKTLKSIELLYMLELFDLAFVAYSGKVLLTPLGQKLLYYLNSSLYYL